MTVRLVGEDDSNLRYLDELKEGELAVIVSWGCETGDHHGTIVQRFEKNLITVGENSGQSWSAALTSDKTKHNDAYRVRVLPPGTRFEIVEE